jgi:AraC family transcriptional regulator, melibiose operon regulatory protein
MLQWYDRSKRLLKTEVLNMDRGKLEEYLYSRNLGVIDEGKILKEWSPSTVTVDGEAVYLFNRTFDINDSPIEENISISQQPYHSEIPLHMHNYIEMMFVYRGTCTVSVKGRSVVLNQGELILINKDTPHSVDAITTADIVMNMILKQDYLTPAFLSRLSKKSIISQFMIESLLSNRKQNQFLIFRPDEHNKVTEIIENIMCEFFDRDFCSDEIIDSYLVVLFSTLIRYNNTQIQHTAVTTNSHESLIDFLKYIEDHYRDCNLVTMGYSFGFHPNYLSAVLKKGTGKSFKELLQLQKLNQAALLLSQSDLSIPEVAEEVGYSSVTFFYKKFKELYHDTPHIYRERMKQKNLY